MHNALRMSRRAFTVAVVAATIAWSIGLAALVTPLTANAFATGDLVRASMPAVYYVGSDGKRYVFPNEKTYATWYSDFSGVQVITDAELASMPIGGNVTYKPGVLMVKINTDPKVYAVDAHGTLRWIQSEALATCLYGSNWNTKIQDVPDAFFVNYSVGADISSCGDFVPANATAAATSINQDKSLGSAVVGLSVSMSAGQPAGGTLPLGSMGISLLKADVHNGGSVGIIVDSITLRRTGAGNAADWASIYVYHGNDRLTTGRTINASTHEVTVGGLNMSVAAGATEQIWFAGDVALGGLAGDVHAFQLVNLTSGGTSATGTPFTGSTFTLAGAIAGNMNIANTGVLANVKAGEVGSKLAQFQLTANVENQNVTKISLSYNGTVTRDNLSNFTLKQGGTTVATASAINSDDQLVFVLATPYYMERGTVRTFEVYGDVSGSARAAQNVNFYLDQTADLLSVGLTYGYGVCVINGYAIGAVGAVANVEAGTLNISYNGPAASNIARSGQDKEIFNFTMTPQSNLEVRTITFNIALGGPALIAHFSDLKLVDTATGQIVAGPYTPVVGANAMNDVINMTSGVARTFKLTVDVENTALALGTITATLNAFGAADVRNLDNSTNLVPATDIIPAGAIAGNAHTVQVSSLNVSVSSTPVAQTYIQGSQGVALYGVGLQAGDATDVKVNTIALTGRVEDTVGVGLAANSAQYGVDAANLLNAMVLSAKLMNGSVQVGTTKSPSAAGLMTFDNLNLTVPAGQTMNLTLVGNLATAIPALGDEIDFTVRDVGADNILESWSASDPDGNAVNATTNAAVPADPCPSMNGPDMQIAGAGVLTVVLAPDDVDSEAGLVLGGSSNAVLAKYKFTAQNEELALKKVRMIVTTPNTVSTLSLYDGASLVGGPVAVTGGGVADFSSVNFAIAKDTSKILTVKGNLTAVGAAGSTTGTAATVTLHDGDEAAGVDGTFEVRGTSSGSSTLITATDAVLDNSPAGDIAGRDKIVRKSKPTVALVSLPTSLLTSGTVVPLRISVSADAAGDIALRGLTTLIVDGTQGGATVGVVTPMAGTSSVRVVGDASDVPGTSAFVAACTAGVNCTLQSKFTNEYVISAGTTKTFEVRVALTAAETGDSLSSSIVGDAAVNTGVLIAGVGANLYGVGGVQSNFVWSDLSIVPHSDVAGGPSSADWASGRYVKVVPTDSQTISK